jgi:hypothetical protein
MHEDSHYNSHNDTAAERVAAQTVQHAVARLAVLHVLDREAWRQGSPHIEGSSGACDEGIKWSRLECWKTCSPRLRETLGR